MAEIETVSIVCAFFLASILMMLSLKVLNSNKIRERISGNLNDKSFKLLGNISLFVVVTSLV